MTPRRLPFVQTKTHFRVGFAVLLLLSTFSWGVPSSLASTSGRFAFLIGHQKGWKGDTPLRYAISGDLLPLSRELRRIGFRTVTLVDPSPSQVRQKMQELTKRLKKKQTATHTFFFYYTGHADRQQLHLTKEKKPLRYKELIQFLTNLPTKRRIAVFDSCYSGAILKTFGSMQAYQRLLAQGRSKGFRKKHRVDLRALRHPTSGEESGLRIIASSLGLAWELQSYRASIFTFHLLQGLKGPADQDRDGKITTDELFDYASRKVHKDVGQRPQQLVMIERGLPFAFAPVYRSQLQIGATVKGHLQIAIANFLWSFHKTKQYAIWLAVINGYGTVSLRKGDKCYKQKLFFPKHGEVTLKNNWKAMSCGHLNKRQKGHLQIPTRDSHAFDEPFLSFGAAADVSAVSLPLLLEPRGGFQLSTQIGKHIDILASVHSGQPTGKGYRLTSLSLQIAAGWRWGVIARPSLRMTLFAGAYVGGGPLFQYNQLETKAVWFAQTGLRGKIHIWFSRFFGLFLAPQAGVFWTQGPKHIQPSFQWNLAGGVLFGL